MLQLKDRIKVRRLRYLAFSPELLAKLRKRKGLTQGELAKAVGLSQGVISQYERDREPHIDSLRKLGKFFNVYFVADWSGVHSENEDPLE